MQTNKETFKYHAIGLMSGTSLDGLDIAEVQFTLKDNSWSFQLKNAATISYDSEMENPLKSAVNLSGKNLIKLHHDYGRWIGEKVSMFMNENDSKPEVLCSHGHTVFHQPELGFTHQIGHGQEIANISGVKTICDFRSLDVSLGGQGAPLVPIGDELLFPQYSHCLNLGGIANISFKENDERVSFDICVANMALNYLSNKLDLPFDENGNIAESGKVIPDMLNELNELEYFKLPHPKSLGFEQFETDILPIIKNKNSEIPDILRTFVEHIAIQIAKVLDATSKPKDQVVVTGGGAFNKFLISRIKCCLKSDIEVVIPDSEIVSFKEAIIFAFLGVLRLRNEINSLSSVTGASKDSSGGVIFLPA